MLHTSDLTTVHLHTEQFGPDGLAHHVLFAIKSRTLGAGRQALPELLAQHAQQRLGHAGVVCAEEVARLCMCIQH